MALICILLFPLVVLAELLKINKKQASPAIIAGLFLCPITAAVMRCTGLYCVRGIGIYPRLYYARCGAFCCVVGCMPCKLYPGGARLGIRQAVRRCCRLGVVY